MSDDLQRYFEQEFARLDAELAQQDALAEQLTIIDLQVASRTQKIAQMASTCEEDLNPSSPAARLVRALREGGMSEAIRNIYKASKLPLTAVDVLTELRAINFPLVAYQNVHATIHLTLKRLESQTELLPVKIGSKTAFTWNPSTKRGQRTSFAHRFMNPPKRSGVPTLEDVERERRLNEFKVPEVPK